MLRHWKALFTRHEPHCGSLLVGVKSAAGGMVGMAMVGGIATATGLPFLIAPFGASAVLLFGHPATPLAQPVNVVGGYAAAAMVGMLFAQLFPGIWWAAAVGVGLAILAMLALRLSHPPAGAVPILMVASADGTAPAGGPLGLAGIVIVGSLALVAVALIYHRLPPRHDYPRRGG